MNHYGLRVFLFSNQQFLKQFYHEEIPNILLILQHLLQLKILQKLRTFLCICNISKISEMNKKLEDAKKRRFDGLSFFGGMLFVTSIGIILMFSYNYYKKRSSGINYFELDQKILQ